MPGFVLFVVMRCIMLLRSHKFEEHISLTLLYTIIQINICICDYIVFIRLFSVMVTIFYGLPLHLIREIYMSFHQLRERVVKFYQYRLVTANMNERYFILYGYFVEVGGLLFMAGYFVEVDGLLYSGRWVTL